MRILAGNLCNTSPRTRHNFCGSNVMVIFLNFCFKELRFGLHADSIVVVDFLHALGSIEGGFIYSPNAFKQTLGLFCCNYSLLTHPGMSYFSPSIHKCSNVTLNIPLLHTKLMLFKYLFTGSKIHSP